MTSVQRDATPPPSLTRSRGATGHAHIRGANMSLVLHHLRAHGGRSRAQLAVETGLAKATVSSLVVELIERGLAQESEISRQGAVGRPGVTVELDGTRICGLGLAVHVEYLALVALDLQSNVLHEEVLPLEVDQLTPDQVLDELAGLVAGAHRVLDARGVTVVATGVAVPGVIDLDEGLARFAPNIGWRGIGVRDGLADRTDLDPASIHVENDAKMAAIAEFAHLSDHALRDVLYLTGDIGTGAGIIADGELVRGWSGFAGDVGHLPFDPARTPCSCGRVGCWETQVGLLAFLRRATVEGDPARNRAVRLDDRIRELLRRADDGDLRVRAALARLADDLVAGLSILTDTLNPRAVILGGYFGFAGKYLLEPVGAALAQRWTTPGSEACLVGSRLGLVAAAQGGAQHALDQVYLDPTLAVRERVTDAVQR